MIESRLSTPDINNMRPSLADLYPDNQDDWDFQIAEALKEVTADVQEMGWNIRKLCKRYSLQDSVIKTATYTGTITEDEDNLQRLRIVVNVTELTGSAVLLLEGTNDDGTTYTIVKGDMNIDAVGEYTTTITNVFKKYRLSITGISDMITFDAYLIETTFERIHLYKTLEIIYGLLNALRDDVYSEQVNTFAQKYLDKLNSVQFAYDDDDDEVISDDESEINNQEVIFRA